MSGRCSKGDEAGGTSAERPSATPGQPDLDRAGQSILELINRAAGVSEENSRQAVEMAQKLLRQLQVSQDHVAQLEAELANYRERADRAEHWLRRIYAEIDDRFLQQGHSRRGHEEQSG